MRLHNVLLQIDNVMEPGNAAAQQLLLFHLFLLSGPVRVQIFKFFVYEVISQDSVTNWSNV